jgi:myo-inositol-1(or 4)-monophosphatase
MMARPRESRSSGNRAETPGLDAPALLLAAERAVGIGADLLRRGHSHVGALISKGDRDYATEVDFAIERAVKEALAEDAPDIPFLGEEEGGADLDADTLWVLDPIDGTINFSHQSPLCGISLALVHSGRPILALVDLPLLGERFVARDGAGAFLNGRQVGVNEVPELNEAVVAITDFAVGPEAKVENPIHLAVTRRLASASLRVRVHGCACLDLAWLAAGRLNATFMLSNRPWDVSAGVLLVREAGGVVYDYDGAPYTSRSRFTIASASRLTDSITELIGQSVAETAAEGAPRAESSWLPSISDRPH